MVRKAGSAFVRCKQPSIAKNKASFMAKAEGGKVETCTEFCYGHWVAE